MKTYLNGDSLETANALSVESLDEVEFIMPFDWVSVVRISGEDDAVWLEKRYAHPVDGWAVGGTHKFPVQCSSVALYCIRWLFTRGVVLHHVGVARSQMQGRDAES